MMLVALVFFRKWRSLAVLELSSMPSLFGGFHLRSLAAVSEKTTLIDEPESFQWTPKNVVLVASLVLILNERQHDHDKAERAARASLCHPLQQWPRDCVCWDRTDL